MSPVYNGGNKDHDYERLCFRLRCGLHGFGGLVRLTLRCGGFDELPRLGGFSGVWRQIHSLHVEIHQIKFLSNQQSSKILAMFLSKNLSWISQ